MNKRKLHHYWRYVRDIKVWQLSLLFVVLVLGSTWALRNNSKQVIPLVNAVMAADKNGEGTDEALKKLGNYMTNHMNSQIGSPIRLENTYYRDFNQAINKTQASADGNIYREAQKQCEDPNVLLSVRAQCVQEYVTKNARPGNEAKIPDLPDPDAYTFTFISPRWSPDLAGILILLTFYASILLLSRVIAGFLVKKTLSSRI